MPHVFFCYSYGYGKNYFGTVGLDRTLSSMKETVRHENFWVMRASAGLGCGHELVLLLLQVERA